MLEEENDFTENDFKRNYNCNTTTYSISALNDDISTYTGVKSVNEEQSCSTNKNKKSQNNKNRKIKKQKSFSSITESSNSESSKSEKELQKEKNIEKTKKGQANYENILEKEKEKENILEKINTIFEWDGGGEEVYITGSFCDWKDFYKMTKNNKGIFKMTLSLPRGFHQYKFKVDHNWVYSKNLPKYEDNGNVNNFIDTTDYSKETDDNNDNNKNDKNIEKPNEEIKIKTKDKKHKKFKKRFSSVHTVNFLNSQNNYTIYYPLRTELNIRPSSLPCLYKAHFILNEDFKPKKERKFTKVEYVNDSNDSSSESSSSSFSETSSEHESSNSKVTIFGEIISYVKFQNLYHIHSNHLHAKKNNYKGITVTSMTSRYRIKFATFIYYKPNEKIEKKRRVTHSRTVKIKKRKKNNN